jgi:hypothetical protein
MDTKSFETDMNKIPLIFKKCRILKTLVLSVDSIRTITRADIVFIN